MGSPMIEDECDEPRAETPLVEDDLEEVDFYAHQGMYDEAIESLQALMERHPNHRLLLAKMHEIDALARRLSTVARDAARRHARHPARSRTAPITPAEPTRSTWTRSKRSRPTISKRSTKAAPSSR